LCNQLHLEAGYADSQQGRWADALQHWQAAQKAGDNSRQLITNMAVAHDRLGQFRQRDYEEAITTYRNALKWSPDNIDLRLDLVDMLQAEGRWQAAESELKRILKKYPDHIAALRRQAESCEADGDLEEARYIWQRILEIEPQNSVARPQLAHLYEEQIIDYTMEDRPQEAIAVCQEGLEEFPDNPRLYALTGAAYADLDDFDQARYYFERALALDTDHLLTLRVMLSVWTNYRQFDQIDKTLETVKALDPPAPASFLLDLVEHCRDADLTTWVWRLLEFIEQLYPDDPQVLLEIAWWLLRSRL
jgi:tetratricopeptide (TPR) repeat protein